MIKVTKRICVECEKEFYDYVDEICDDCLYNLNDYDAYNLEDE